MVSFTMVQMVLGIERDEPGMKWGKGSIISWNSVVRFHGIVIWTQPSRRIVWRKESPATSGQQITPAFPCNERSFRLLTSWCSTRHCHINRHTTWHPSNHQSKRELVTAAGKDERDCERDRETNKDWKGYKQQYDDSQQDSQRRLKYVMELLLQREDDENDCKKTTTQRRKWRRWCHGWIYFWPLWM